MAMGKAGKAATGKIAFTRPAPWACPQYRDYYIQERYDGQDIYGHKAYSYALFRREHFTMVRKFRTRKQAYRFLTEKTGIGKWEIKWQSSSIVTNDAQILGIQQANTLYKLDKRTRTVWSRPADDAQLTGWYMRYHDCVKIAKGIIGEDNGG